MAASPVELPAQVPLVGRENEFAKLRQALDDAVAGKGRTIILSGEAGIGKTRLLDELRALAREKGAKVMSGICFAENLTPYIAYVEAFKEGKIDHLFAEDAVRMETLYLVDKSGVLLAKAERTERPIDPDIFSAMLSAVESFVRDSLKGGMEEGALNVLGYAEYRIVIEQAGHSHIVAILTGKENEFLVKDIRDALEKFEERFGHILEDWDGDVDVLKGSDEILEELLRSEKYEGLDPTRADPEVRRNRLFDNVALGLVREAKVQPVVLCLDDLQWADSSTLALTHYVSRNARDAGLLIVGTYRSEDIAAAPAGGKHPLVETMQLMSREGLHDTVEVHRLGANDVRDLLTKLLGQVEFPDDFDPGVFKESGGNPFYLLEITRMMVADGVLVKKDGTWRFTRSLSQVDMPSRVQDILIRRLQRVEQTDRDLLDVAAVIGESFDAELLSQTAGKQRLELIKTLRALEDTHRLVRSGDEGYEFDHAKIREVLYVELPEPLRREYHGLIGTTIESIHAQELDEFTAELAHHFYQARNRTKGIKYTIAAGDKSRQLFANEEAIRVYSQSLELMGSDPKWHDKMLHLLETKADLQDLAGHFDGALRSYELVLEAGPTAETRARMHRRRGAIYLRRGDYRRSETELNAAEGALEGSGPELGRVKLWQGRLENRRGNNMRAALLLVQAAREAQAGDQQDRAEAEDGLAFVHWVRQEVSEARQYWERSIYLREQMDDQKGLRGAYNNLANTYAALGDMENAAKYYEKSLKIAQKIGDQAGATRPLINLGRVYSIIGRREQSIESYNKALKTSVRIGDQRGVASVHRSLGVLYADGGDREKARENFERALLLAQRIGDRVLLGGAQSGLAEVAAKEGRHDEARQWFEQALEVFKKSNVPDDIVYTSVMIGWLDLAEGDVSSAETRLEEAKAVPFNAQSNHVTGSISGLQGAIARRKGEDARPDLETALEKMPATAIFEVVRVKREMGELLVSRNDPDAATHLQSALDLAERVGEATQATEIQALLARAR